MKKTEEKTNALRLLDAQGVAHQTHSYDPDAVDGEAVAALTGIEPDRVFKTLVTVGASRRYYVFDVPVNCTLSLKKAAHAVGEKNIAMLPQKELLPLTGYIHGGCSPIGMKKPFPTVLHESAADCESIYVSAGKIGYQVQLSPGDLQKMLPLKCCDVIK